MKTVQLADVRLNYVDEGTGLPLVFIHGFPLDHTMWSEQIREFAPHFRVIAPDLRGFGRSSVTGETVAMDQFASDLAGLLDAAGVHEPVILCGLSMGGYVAFQFWRQFPERVHSLILCDTRAAGDGLEAAETRFKTADKALLHGAAIVAEGMLPKLFAEHTRRENPNVVEATRQVMLRTDPRSMAGALRGMAARPDMRDRLPEIAVPTLVVCGEDDVITSLDEMRAMADAIPEAEWLAVPAAGHMAPLENPVVVNNAIRRFTGLEAVEPEDAES